MSENKLYAPEGMGPFSIEGASYEVNPEDRSVDITSANAEHVRQLTALGCTGSPAGPPAIGARVQSDFGPSTAEYEELRAKYEALVEANEKMIGEEQDLELVITVELAHEIGTDEPVMSAAARLLRKQAEDLAEARAALEAAQAPPPPPPASENTLETLTKVTQEDDKEEAPLADPGFTDESDYQAILEWLKANGAAVPGNISKAKALEIVPEVLAARNGTGE